ncbi:uncharacterized protein LOC143880726 [Tasmannia lanceolata]|uniref:uncharacterized protein LOC143880726 n=1 Tax=Tasmannia lanceolata TaxID=3420 RepID=UPI0040648468
MELQVTTLSVYSSFILSVNLIFCTATTISLGNETDRMALLAFKDRISSDPLGALSSWNHSLHFCKWKGVTCGCRHPRVTVLDLGQQKLLGSVSPSISNLTFLRRIHLEDNSFSGQIFQEIGRLFRLRFLNMNDNSLGGEIPANLSRCMHLQAISLGNNNLTGKIPVELGTLKNLKLLILGSNFLIGSIPPSLGNLSSLTDLVLWINSLGGSIPGELSQIQSLVSIGLSGGNHFSGPVPEDLGSLQHLTKFYLWGNQFGTGNPDDLSFITSLTNCSNLESLDLSENRFKGILPSSIANLSTHLSWLGLGQNQIVGSIPSHIGNLVNLQFLGIYKSFITGTIPTSIGKLRNLRKMYMYENMLSGQIPSSIGSIPSALGNHKNLEEINLSENMLHGAIPRQVICLSSLSIGLDLSHNSLTRSLALDVGNLIHLSYLDVSSNILSGEIPSTLGNCESLINLYMDVNSFLGTIPSSLSGLKAIQFLGLSYNNFSGRIPKYLEELQLLTYLNLSFNNLQSEVPKQGVFRNTSVISVIGNDNLCGGIPELKLDQCIILDNEKKRKSHVSKVIIPVAWVALCLIFFSCASVALYWLRKSRKKPSLTTSIEGQYLKVSYAELFKATNGFSSANLIGVGSNGTVYKGILGHEENIVAVKVFNLQLCGALKSFMAECKALRNIRHRNLVKIITSCSSIKFGGDDFKALVFEYMPNGSLEKWLHPKVDEQHKLRTLTFIERLNVSIDVAFALDYLHHHCHTPIIHCDLKPSNILLDEDMNGHLGDFGLAMFYSKIICNSSEDQSSTIGLKGTVGYIAPEYGIGGLVSKSGDVYSYGILLLELFTGKCPTNDMFKDGLSLRKFVESALPEGVMKILDPLLPLEDEEERGSNNARTNRERIGRLQECLVSLFSIGVVCSADLPRERTEMGDIAKEMHAIRDRFLGLSIHRE